MNCLNSKMKKISAGVGATAVLFALGTLIPSTIKAGPNVAPTQVLVTNEPGRLPYQTQVAGLTSTNCSAFGCSFTFKAVPAGHRLVVQHLTMFIQPKPGSVPARVGLASTLIPSSMGPVFFATVQGLPTVSPSNQIVLDQPVTYYYDSGDSPIAYIDGISIDLTAPNNSQGAVLIGYLVDCGAAACSPIVR